MLIMYAVYCVALSFNAKLERWAKSYNIPFLPKDDEPAEESALVSYRSLQEDRLSYTGPNSPVTEQVKSQEGNLLFLSVSLFSTYFRQICRCFLFSFQEMAFKKRPSSNRYRNSLNIIKQKNRIPMRCHPSWCQQMVISGPYSPGVLFILFTSCAERRCRIAGRKSGEAGTPSLFAYLWFGLVSIAT